MNGGKRPRLALRCAEGVIRTACLLLPEVDRVEREAEWCEQAEAIASDPDIPWRAVEVLKYALPLLPCARATRSASTAMAQRAALHRSFKYGLVALDQILTDGFKQGRIGGRFLGIATVVLGVSGVVSLVGGVVSLISVGVGRTGVVGVFLGVLGVFLGGGGTFAILERLRMMLRREESARDG
ncbi:hypothetical protein SAMN06272781_0112 [Streptomyces sp. 1222.2]|nr:hypothetical protein SAMN06272781_0112 [Streptomyces sp. 1222.2]